MPTYRIEVCPNNRAGCKDPVCKAKGEKIKKGELRFATWVEISRPGSDGFASWAYKHWGCVSGAQIVTLRELCDQGDGDYDFNIIDGYDEMEDHPEIQEKIRRCVQQGHIDPEDFNGDPEKNKPGVKGIHLTAKQKEKRDQEAADAAAQASEIDADTKKAKPKAKRGRKKADDDDDDDEEPQAKKTKTVKNAKGGRKPSGLKVKDESEDEHPELPASKGRKKGTKVKPDVEADSMEPVSATKNARRPVKVKKEETPEAQEEAPKPAEKAKRKPKTTAQEKKPESEGDEPEAKEDTEAEPASKKKGRRASARTTDGKAEDVRSKSRRRSSRNAS